MNGWDYDVVRAGASVRRKRMRQEKRHKKGMDGAVEYGLGED